jgi:hypothetical protein
VVDYVDPIHELDSVVYPPSDKVFMVEWKVEQRYCR